MSPAGSGSTDAGRPQGRVLTLRLTHGQVTVVADAGGRAAASWDTGSGREHHPAEAVWQTLLAAVRQVLETSERGTPGADDPGDPRRPLVQVAISSPTDSVALWDAETLGSPRPLALGVDPAAELADVAAHEAHTWALVLTGRHLVGPLGSYLVARMTRGLEHGLPDDGAWPALLQAQDVPVDSRPAVWADDEVLGTTDPASFCGLELPVRLLPPP